MREEGLVQTRRGAGGAGLPAMAVWASVKEGFKCSDVRRR